MGEANGPTGALSSGQRVVQYALLAAPVVILGIVAYQHRIMVDDGFINLRIVDQILAGHGPVFNTGQRVEAFTSPLWLFVLTVAEVLTPIRAEYLSVGLGILFTLAGLALAMTGAAVLHRTDRPRLLIPAGVLVPVAIVGVWYFASSGLETGLIFAWEGGAMLVLARWARRGRLPWWGAVLLGLGWLIRPDLGLISAAFAAAVLVAGWRESTWGSRTRLLALMFGLPLLYQLFRMGYYGLLVPNTALAKEATASHWGRGVDYLRATIDPYWLWVPLLVLAAGAYAPLLRDLHTQRRTRALAVVAAFVVGAFLDGLYNTRVGGDYFHARLLLPALFAVCAPVAVVPLRSAYALALLVIPWAVGVGVFVRGPDRYFRPTFEAGITVADRGWEPGGPKRAWYTGPAVYVGSRRLTTAPAPDLRLPTGVSGGIGVSGYALGIDFDMIDVLGLADPITSHLELVRTGYPGHEKLLPPPWVAALITAPHAHVDEAEFRQPAFLIPLIPPTRGRAFQRQVAAARAALRCDAISDLQRSYTQPLTVGRVASNFFDAFDHTRFRIPPNPVKAARELCPPGSRRVMR